MSSNRSIDGDGDIDEDAAPQMLESTRAALQDVNIRNASPSVGKTFVVDPKVMAQWASGQDGTTPESSDKDRKSAKTTTEKAVDAVGSSTNQLSAEQDHLTPGDTAEVGVSVQKKSKKKKSSKSKSKRGLVRISGLWMNDTRTYANHGSYTGSTFRFRRILRRCTAYTG